MRRCHEAVSCGGCQMGRPRGDGVITPGAVQRRRERRRAPLPPHLRTSPDHRSDLGAGGRGSRRRVSNIIFHFIPYHSIPFHSIPFHSIPFHSIPFHTIPYHSVPFRTIPYHSVPIHFRYLGAGVDEQVVRESRTWPLPTVIDHYRPTVTSAPGWTSRWYVLQNMSCVPASFALRESIAFPSCPPSCPRHVPRHAPRHAPRRERAPRVTCVISVIAKRREIRDHSGRPRLWHVLRAIIHTTPPRALRMRRFVSFLRAADGPPRHTATL